MRVFAVYSIKGGVGKTASAVNVADLAARSGLRTLLWDLDPQGAASFYLRVKPKVKGGAEKLLRGKRSIRHWLRASDFDGLHLLPADFSYRNMDLVLDAQKKPRKRLSRLLAPLAKRYDAVFLDCPPSVSLLSESVFQAADAVLSPTIPTPLSLRSYDQLVRHLDELVGKPPRLLPFLAQVDRRKKIHCDIMDQIPSSHPEFLKSWIPSASVVEQMGTHRAPLGAFAPRSHAGLAYASLWDEVQSAFPE
ncbi:MAG: ParA family protein [Deltaproteobacteria bacterium]|nr:ParA family protein [Deltaproteobacteria bacterium]MBW2418036.1 ParA family protein [Deltaproteobacteria bacterium]